MACSNSYSHRHVPKPIYNATKEKHEMLAAQVGNYRDFDQVLLLKIICLHAQTRRIENRIKSEKPTENLYKVGVVMVMYCMYSCCNRTPAPSPLLKQSNNAVISFCRGQGTCLHRSRALYNTHELLTINSFTEHVVVVDVVVGREESVVGIRASRFAEALDVLEGAAGVSC